MRFLLRHLLAILLLLFFCKIAVEAQDSVAQAHLPKALILSQLAPDTPIPARIDTTRVIRSIRQAQNGL
jgi:hypothetical protein